MPEDFILSIDAPMPGTPEGQLFSDSGIGVYTVSGERSMYFRHEPYPGQEQDLRFVESLGWAADNVFLSLGWLTDELIASIGNSVLGSLEGLSMHPDGPNQAFDFSGCNFQCDW